MIITFTGLTTLLILIQLYRYFGYVLQLRNLYKTVDSMKKPAKDAIAKVRKSLFLQTIIIIGIILFIFLIIFLLRLLHFRIRK